MADLQLEMDMDFIAKLSEDQKVAFLKAFSRLAAADGHLNADEVDFIKHVAMTFGISEARVNDILKIDNDEEIIEAVKLIDNRRAALELIKEMCVLAHADDELSDEETVLIGKVGLAMGVDLEKIEQISNWVIDRLIWLEEAKIIFEEV